MIVIKDVVIWDSDADLQKVYRGEIKMEDSCVTIDNLTQEEVIKGQRFVNDRGEVVVLGFSKDVERTIGLAFKSLETMNEQLASYQCQSYNQREKIITLRQKILIMNNMNWLERLTFLFTGKIGK